MFSRSILSLALTTTIPALAADLPRFEGETLFVTATRTPGETARVAADALTITGEVLRTSGVQTLGDALANQPGMTLTRDGGPGQSAALFIRGTESRHALILVDGMRVGSASTGTTSFDLLPIEAIDRIEIVKGPASALYGSDAVGGVVQIFTRRGQGKATAFVGVEAGSWGQRGGYAGIGGVVGDTRYSLTLNQKQAEGFSAVASPKSFSFDPDKDGYRRQGVATDVAHYLTETQEIGLRGFYQEQVTDIDAGMGKPGAEVRQGLQNVQTYWKSQWQDDWQTELHLGQSKDRYVADVYAARYVTRQDQVGAQSRVKTGWGEWLAAYDFQRERLDSLASYSVNSRRNQSMLLGWQADFGIHHLEAQARRDWNSQFGGFNTGRVGYAVMPAKGWKLYANAGRAFHAPTFNDAYYNFLDDNAAWMYYYRFEPNPGLKPEQSRSYEVGFNWENGPHKAALSIYRTQVRDLIALLTLVDDYTRMAYPYGYTVQGMTNVSSALIKGGDVRLATKYSMFSLESWGNWQTTRNESAGTRLPRRAGISGGVRLGVEPLANLAGFVELTGQGMRYDNLANTKPLHGYGLVNLGVDYHINKQWRASARIGNIFERKYELVRDYGVPGRNALLRLSWNGN